jgi:hypothetical protein
VFSFSVFQRKVYCYDNSLDIDLQSLAACGCKPQADTSKQAESLLALLCGASYRTAVSGTRGISIRRQMQPVSTDFLSTAWDLQSQAHAAH